MNRIGVFAVLCFSFAALADHPGGPSLLGKVFDEGPRQQATLLEGVGKVEFPIVTSSKDAQRFFNQGVAQLHGAWSYEAERSFRQAAKLDPTSPMPYWGMAMANTLFDLGDARRAADFTKEAEKRLGKTPDKREAMYVGSMTALFAKGFPIPFGAKKAHVDALADLVVEFPKDSNARAFLVLQRLHHTKGTPAQLADILDGVLSEQKDHPAHHYKVRLYQKEDQAKGIDSTKVLASIAPAVPPTWHASGQLYLALKEYHNACWYLEGSARADHKFMAATLTMPFLIQTHFQNNNWLAASYLLSGRIADSIEMVKNLISLPLHPKWNPIGNGTRSAAQQLLIGALYQSEQWDDVLALVKTKYLDRVDNGMVAMNRHRIVAIAYLHKNDQASLEREIAALKGTLDAVRKIVPAENVKEFDALAQHRVEELESYVELLKGNVEKALSKLLPQEAGHLYAKLLEADADKYKNHAKLAVSQFFANGITPTLALAKKLFVADRLKDADVVKTTAAELMKLSGRIDQKNAVFARVDAIMKAQGHPADWGTKHPPKMDGHADVTKLGPLHWEPTAAPELAVIDTKGAETTRAALQKGAKPVLLVFHFGESSADSKKQLEALSKATADFQKAGIEVAAIGSDSVKNLKDWQDKASFPFTMLSDAKHGAFKSFRAFDDFENFPLFSVVLVDGAGKIRWQDHGASPFMDFAFLLREAQWLLRP